MEKMFAETYSGLLITRTLANLNLALTRTKIDFPWISNFVSPKVIFYIISPLITRNMF